MREEAPPLAEAQNGQADSTGLLPTAARPAWMPPDWGEVGHPLAPKRFNPGALVEFFVGGVNAAGGVWNCASGKPFTDLGSALQPHVAKAANVLGRSHELGEAWFTYCAGAPRDAWKAAAWLGEGAPERPRSKVGAEPTNEREAVAVAARRGAEARAREGDRARTRREEQRAPPPAEALELLSRWAIPPPAPEPRAADEQLTELAKLGGGGTP